MALFVGSYVRTVCMVVMSVMFACLSIPYERFLFLLPFSICDCSLCVCLHLLCARNVKPMFVGFCLHSHSHTHSPPLPLLWFVPYIMSRMACLKIHSRLFHILIHTHTHSHSQTHAHSCTKFFTISRDRFSFPCSYTHSPLVLPQNTRLFFVFAFLLLLLLL